MLGLPVRKFPGWNHIIVAKPTSGWLPEKKTIFMYRDEKLNF